jgi:hypothetical protein
MPVERGETKAYQSGLGWDWSGGLTRNQWFGEPPYYPEVSPHPEHAGEPKKAVGMSALGHLADVDHGLNEKGPAAGRGEMGRRG